MWFMLLFLLSLGFGRGRVSTVEVPSPGLEFRQCRVIQGSVVCTPPKDDPPVR